MRAPMNSLVCQLTIFTTIFAMLNLRAIAIAEDYRAQWVEAVNNVVKCKIYQNGWFLTTTGPCSDFKPPETIAIGEHFSEGGHSHVVRIIIATRSEIDYKI